MFIQYKKKLETKVDLLANRFLKYTCIIHCFKGTSNY